jgi:hypothetical protein
LNPLYAVVTLDTSGSMRQRLPEAKAAAQAFIDGLAAEDRVRAVSFAREVKALNGVGADRQSARAGLNGTVARGDTALYDALYASIELTREQPGRKAVILLSDGVDDDGAGRQLSKRSLSEALDLARSVNVPVYAIGLGTEIDDGVLRRVAEETGGQYYKVPEAAELRELYARIGEQLSGQYSISYESNLPADGADHRVGVTVAGITGTKVYRASPGTVTSSQPTRLSAAVVSPDGRVAGGDSFETAVLIEPGRTYRLQDHVAKDQPAFFAFDAQPGQQVTASVKTGHKGVLVSNNMFEETNTPYAGLALVNPEREMIGRRLDVSMAPLRKESLQVRVGPGHGGRHYLLVGAQYAAQHRDTEFSVDVTGAGPSGVPARLSTASDYVTTVGGRVAGGGDFETAVPIELGRTYRLEDHLRKGEMAYFAVEVPAGKTVAAFVHTGLKGVAIDNNGAVRETELPSAGIALATADRQMIGKHQVVINGQLKRAGGLYRAAGGKSGKLYVLIGSTFGAQHRDAEFSVRIADETARQ